MKYNFQHSLLKTAIRLVLFFGPMALANLPANFGAMSVSAILSMGFDWFKAKYTSIS